MAIWMAAVLLVNLTYNNWGWKAIPVLDVLNQVGYLLIFLLAATMLLETAIAAAFFQGTVVAAFMAVGTAFFAFDALLGPPRYPVLFTKAFFVAWNLIVIATMHWVWRDEWFFIRAAG